VDGYGETVLHFAAHYGHTECVKYMLEIGSDVHTCNNSGWTIRVELVRALLDAWATVDAANNDEWTSLNWAIYNNHQELARLLIDRGAKRANVKLSKHVQSIPDWIHQFITSRSRCCSAAIAVIGIHRYHRATITEKNDIVIRLLVKHIWASRMDDSWNAPSVVAETK
jgi:ankyrin repeat protein